jgi:glycosyltransferase involved in cell wall biosynthesis
MTLLESMNIGLPCIVTNVGKNTVVIAHEQTCLILKNDNLEQVTNAIGSLANTPAKTKAFSAAVVAFFNEKFTQQQMNHHSPHCQQCYFSAFNK